MPLLPYMPAFRHPAPGAGPTRVELRKSYTDNDLASPFAEDSLGYKLGHGAMSFLRGPNAFTASFDRGPVSGALDSRAVNPRRCP